jgi:hypothetical protein
VNEMEYPAWERPYREATQETDKHRLLKLVGNAEEAIFQRLQELAVSRGGDAEKRAIQAACDNLLKIKTERLGWPSLPGARREARREARATNVADKERLSPD